jgi:hypothetical protein
LYVCTHASIFAFCWRLNQEKLPNNTNSTADVGLFTLFERYFNVMLNVKRKERKYRKIKNINCDIFSGRRKKCDMEKRRIHKM